MENEGVQIKVARLEERVESHHQYVREKLNETIELFAKQNTKVDLQLSTLTRDVRIVTWTLGTIGALIGASQSGVLDAIKLLLGGM